MLDSDSIHPESNLLSLSFDTHNVLAQSHLLLLDMPKPLAQGVPVIQVDGLKHIFVSTDSNNFNKSQSLDIHAEGTEI